MSSAREPDEIDNLKKQIDALDLEKAKRAGMASPLTFILASLKKWGAEANKTTNAELGERVKEALESFTTKLQGIKQEAETTSGKSIDNKDPIVVAINAASTLAASKVTVSSAMTFSTSNHEKKVKENSPAPTALEVVNYGGQEVEAYLNSVKATVNKELTKYIQSLMQSKGDKNVELRTVLMAASQDIVGNKVQTLDKMEEVLNKVKEAFRIFVIKVDLRNDVEPAQELEFIKKKALSFGGGKAVEIRNDYMKEPSGGRALFTGVLKDIDMKKTAIDAKFLEEVAKDGYKPSA